MNIELLGSLPWDVRLNKLVDESQVEAYYTARIAAIVEKIVVKTE